MKEEDEFDVLEYRLLNTRAKRTTTPKAESKPEEKPEIHVHVAMPEVKEKSAPKSESPRKWRFTHKYDQHNKLVETIATAE